MIAFVIGLGLTAGTMAALAATVAITEYDRLEAVCLTVMSAVMYGAAVAQLLVALGVGR